MIGRLASAGLGLALAFAPVAAEPVAPDQIQAIDGDTVRAYGVTVRLVGFDTPESGNLAKCDAERVLARKATARLSSILAAGNNDLEIVPCACRPGTEGTRRCNHGRACGVLRHRGQGLAQIMVAEGLARPYACERGKCPRRGSWCD